MTKHRQITSQGVQLIKTFEGFSSIPYICQAGVNTIGYGHAIRKGEKWDNPNAIITEEEAIELLRQDVNIAERAVLRLIRVPLEDWHFDSLVSFTFNLGSGALQASTLRRRLNEGDYYGASLQFDRWVYGGGRRLPGLVRRRRAERILFQSGMLLI